MVEPDEARALLGEPEAPMLGLPGPEADPEGHTGDLSARLALAKGELGAAADPALDEQRHDEHELEQQHAADGDDGSTMTLPHRRLAKPDGTAGRETRVGHLP